MFHRQAGRAHPRTAFECTRAARGLLAPLGRAHPAPSGLGRSRPRQRSCSHCPLPHSGCVSARATQATTQPVARPAKRTTLLAAGFGSGFNGAASARRAAPRRRPHQAHDCSPDHPRSCLRRSAPAEYRTRRGRDCGLSDHITRKAWPRRTSSNHLRNDILPPIEKATGSGDLRRRRHRYPGRLSLTFLRGSCRSSSGWSSCSPRFCS